MKNISAGNFNTWIHNFIESRKTSKGMTVSCGDCRACCTSSYFIHIETDETKTLSLIPKELLFSAPGLPKGHVLMGYNEQGHCPMFKDNKCSIYEFRPQTCRNFDCRIFAATGLYESQDKPLLVKRIKTWQFEFPNDIDKEKYKAIKNAVHFLQEYTEAFPKGFVPLNPSPLALLAIRIHDLFLVEPENLYNNDFVANLIKQIYDRVDYKN